MAKDKTNNTATNKPVITVSSLSFSYKKNKVLDNISFEILENDFVALIGPNGSGKTTLVKMLLGFLPAPKESITCSIPLKKIGYVPQRYTIDKNFPGTVEEILSTKSGEVISRIGIKEILTEKFINLSGGQQQRVLIALALQRNPKLLILDEPTAGVDIKSQQAFYDFLKDLNKKGITIILVTHEVGVIPSLVKTVLCINHNICCLGQSKELPKLLKQMYGEHVIHHHHPHGGHNHD